MPDQFAYLLGGGDTDGGAPAEHGVVLGETEAHEIAARWNARPGASETFVDRVRLLDLASAGDHV